MNDNTKNDKHVVVKRMTNEHWYK